MNQITLQHPLEEHLVTVRVDKFHREQPQPNNTASDVDFYGWVEIDYTIIGEPEHSELYCDALTDAVIKEYER